MSAVYYYGQDGEVVDPYIKELFGLGEKELRWSEKHKKSVFSVVGFVFSGDKILVIFPKHYFSIDELDKYNSTHAELAYDIKLLYNVIRKYSEKSKANAEVMAYIGSMDGYDSDYPFSTFYEIYDYYKKYGLYKEKNDIIVPGGSGEVSWKRTIDRAQKIISDGNLIFSTLYVKKKNLNDVFITECMAFIIDHTIDNFQCLLSMRKTGYHCEDFDYLNNIDFVIAQLNRYKSAVFKDIHKHLILNMINFFEQYIHKSKSKGGRIHVKIRYFDMIWQDMVENYLNKHFLCIDETEEKIIFDTHLRKSSVNFLKERFDIDNSYHKFHIDVDHIAYDKNILYIFDSKYFFELNELNYKQYAYNEILRYRFSETVNIFNALILPGKEDCRLHFSLRPDYIGERKMGNKIIEQYLEPNNLMESYLNNV